MTSPATARAAPEIDHDPAARLVSLASAGAWTATGAVALLIGLGSPLDPHWANASWCGFEAGAPALGDHCALCWAGAAALVAGLVQGGATLARR